MNRKFLSGLFYLALLLMSIVANMVPLSLDFGLTFIIPTIFLLIIVSLYSLRIGIFSALLTAAIGFYFEGSLMSSLLLVTEITAVGLLLKYRKLGLLNSSFLYWAFLGLPIFAVYIYVFSGLGGWFALLALISKLLNNILCALAAEILVMYIPFKKWIRGHQSNTFSFQYLISHVILLAVALPYTIFLLSDLHYTQNQIERSMNSQLHGQSKIITNELRDWDELSILALRLQGVFQVSKIDALMEHIDDQGLHVYIMDEDHRILYTNAPNTVESMISKFSGAGHFIEIGKNSYQWMPMKPNGIDDVAIIDESSYLYTVDINNNSMHVLLEAPLRSVFEEEIQGFALEYVNLLVFIIIGLVFTLLLKRYLMRTFGKLSETTTDLPQKLKESAHFQWPTTRMIEFNKLTDNFKEMSSELTEMFVELEESRDRLHHLAYSDSLTGVKNRSYFMGMLKESVASAVKESPHALLFMDLDGFKGINDTYGHDAGDAVLQEVAKRLNTACGKEGSLARLGGDEFVVLLPDSSRESAAEMAGSIVKQIEKPIQYSGSLLQVGISIGISLYLQDSHSVDELMHHGDMAMYASKAAKGSCFTFYDAILQERVEHE